MPTPAIGGKRGTRATRSILELDDTESPIRKRTEDFSDDEDEYSRDLAPASADEVFLADDDADDGDDEDAREPARGRTRSKSMWVGAPDSAPVANPTARRQSQGTSSKRPLKDREKKALEEGLEYHGGEDVRGGRNRAPSLDGSDVSDSDVERQSMDGDVPPKRPLATRKLRRLKLLMLGDIGVGKTSLMRRWTGESVEGEMVSTTGVDFTTKVIDLKGEKIQVQIWDTAGQTRFHVITHSYYKGCNGILLVYDAENAAPNQLHYWIDNIKRHAGDAVEVLLLCNKIDLLPKDKAEQSGQVLSGKEIAKEMDIPLFLTSAMTGKGVDNAFNHVVERCAMAEQRPSHTYKRASKNPKNCAPSCAIS